MPLGDNGLTTAILLLSLLFVITEPKRHSWRIMIKTEFRIWARKCSFCFSVQIRTRGENGKAFRDNAHSRISVEMSGAIVFPISFSDCSVLVEFSDWHEFNSSGIPVHKILRFNFSRIFLREKKVNILFVCGSTSFSNKWFHVKKKLPSFWGQPLLIFEGCDFFLFLYGNG